MTTEDLTNPAPPADSGIEPRWPAALGLVAVAGLYFALPRSFAPGPPWLLASAVLALLGLSILARRSGRHDLNEGLGYAVLVLITSAMIYGLLSLVRALPHHAQTPTALLRSGAVLWVTNILVFASWYWRLDAGGPNARDRRAAHTEGAFLFPQMAAPAPGRPGITMAEADGWSPGFVDYLFLAFNTSAAFSPTDVPVLSPWAKLMMMIQASVSLGAVVLLVARAVNVL